MTRTALRALIAHLDAVVFDLDLELTDTDHPALIEIQLQRLLDFAQQRLDDARKDGAANG